MTVFSAIDIQSRFEIQDALSRFCHTLDSNDVVEWKKLFRPNSVVNAPRLGRFEGVEEIAKLPGLVASEGAGAWRHYLINVAMKPLHQNRMVQVDAYCLVSNWRDAGQIIRSWDVRAIMTKSREWQILELNLSPVTSAKRPTDSEETQPLEISQV